MAQSFRFRRGTAAQWTSANPVLAQGEPGFVTDTGGFKIGDGVTPWNSLPTNASSYQREQPNGVAGLDATGLLYASRVPDVSGAVVHVAPTGSNGNNGKLAASAKLTLAAAIAALPSSGGTVLVHGTITETSVVIDRNNVTIRGANRNAVLDASGTAKANGIIAIGRDRVRVEGLRIIGSGQGSQPINTLTAPTVADLANSGCGIIFAGCTNSAVEGCRMESHGGTSGTGDFNGVAAIWLTYGCVDCQVIENTVTDSRNGINEDNFYAANPHGNKIVRNTVSGCRFGIACDSESATTGSSVTTSVGYPVAYDTLIEGNSIRNCVQSGIDLNKARRVRVAFNYVEACGTTTGNSGIVAYGSTSNRVVDVQIIGNQVYACGQSGNTGHGIKIADFAYSVEVASNICAGNIGNGIVLTGTIRFCVVTGNHVNENGQAGIALSGVGGDARTNTISNNHVLSNKQHGLTVQGATACIVSGNMVRTNGTLTANTYDGLRLSDGSTRNSIVGNVVYGAGHRYSLTFVDSASTNNTVSGNDFGDAFNGAAVGVEYGTARLGIAAGAEVQFWGPNGDSLKTTAGAPTGAWPNGATVQNTGDQRIYVKHPAGWRYVLTT